jgi:FMN phosphatase YigB (HAD superfamily)
MMKAVLFDFGGTIDTDGIHWSEQFWDVYQQYGLPVSKQEYEKAYVFAENNMTGKIKPVDDFKTTLETQVRLQIEYLTKLGIMNGNNSYKTIKDLTGICYYTVDENIAKKKTLLESLSSNYSLGVVSNFYGNLEAVLREFTIRKYFSSIIDSEMAGIKKPDPQIFLKALQELDTVPNKAWVVGDSYERDIHPAKKAGCKTIWLDGKSWKRPDDIHEADFIINSLDELKDLIN